MSLVVKPQGKWGMHVQQAAPEDAAAVIMFFQRLYSETDFMLFEPGEAVPSENEQAQRIEHATKTESGAMFLFETDNQIIGACFGTRGIAKRTCHSLHVVGVLRAWVGRGIGNKKNGDVGNTLFLL